MVSQSGWRFWPALWGVFGAMSALLMAWHACSVLDWGWFSVAVALLMAPVAPVFAIAYYRGTPIEKAMGAPSPLDLAVTKWVSYGLWALFGLGVLSAAFGDYEPSRPAISLLIWGICLQELRVAYIVREMQRREAEASEAETAPADPELQGEPTPDPEPVSEDSSRSS